MATYAEINGDSRKYKLSKWVIQVSYGLYISTWILVQTLGSFGIQWSLPLSEGILSTIVLAALGGYFAANVGHHYVDTKNKTEAPQLGCEGEKESIPEEIKP